MKVFSSSQACPLNLAGISSLTPARARVSAMCFPTGATCLQIFLVKTPETIPEPPPASKTQRALIVTWAVLPATEKSCCSISQKSPNVRKNLPYDKAC